MRPASSGHGRDLLSGFQQQKGSLVLSVGTPPLSWRGGGGASSRAPLHTAVSIARAQKGSPAGTSLTCISAGRRLCRAALRLGPGCGPSRSRPAPSLAPAESGRSELCFSSSRDPVPRNLICCLFPTIRVPFLSLTRPRPARRKEECRPPPGNARLQNTRKMAIPGTPVLCSSDPLRFPNEGGIYTSLLAEDISLRYNCEICFYGLSYCLIL